ncbi:MAG: hypothetical protein R8G34_17560 [Paracoccaceae bacterium]|nr:hypothetical protein [Paracoccaceae bacterium]
MLRLLAESGATGESARPRMILTFGDLCTGPNRDSGQKTGLTPVKLHFSTL